MSRTLRVHQIDQLLRNHHHVSLQSFLDTLEVSLATFKRDLEFMRLQLNAPIIYDRTLNAYRLDKQDTIGPRYELPGLWVNASEAHALLVAHELLEQMEPGLLGKHVAPLKNHLLRLLASEGVDTDSVVRRIRVLQSLRRHMPVKHFETAARATLDRSRLKIRHLNRRTGTMTERIISPQRLAHYRENWYLDGWCHLREEIRSFSIDAIETLDILDETAQEIPDDMLDFVLGNGYGIFNGTHKQYAILEFSKKKVPWVSQITWHPEQKTEWLSDGKLRISFPYNDDRELTRDILSHIPEIRVLAPESLRATINRILNKAASTTCP